MTDSHVTRAELAAELRALNNGLTLKLVLVAAILKFELPNEVTVPAVAAMFAKSGWTLLAGRFSTS